MSKSANGITEVVVTTTFLSGVSKSSPMLSAQYCSHLRCGEEEKRCGGRGEREVGPSITTEYGLL